MREDGSAAFARATVVARRSPVSAHLGDSAKIFADGTMEGFIGGACARDIVRRHALRALKNDAAILVQIRPEAASAPRTGDNGSVTVAMTCTSEGAVDIFIEPHLPPRQMIVAGLTPVADAVARLAAAAGYAVRRFVDAAEAADARRQTGEDAQLISALTQYCSDLSETEVPRVAAVVASAGHYDEDALEPLLQRPLPYVGLLASRTRAAAVRSTLAARGISQKRLDEIRNPVGLDLGATDAVGVAVSILAEIVAGGLHAANTTHAESREITVPVAIDPICGMEVDIESARHWLARDGETYYFCGARCLQTFADPASAVPRGGPQA